MKAFKDADCYFARAAQWYVIEGQNMAVIDPAAPKILTFDPWPQILFLAADGKRTIREYIYYMADQYEKDIPPELDKTIIDELLTLLEYKIIKFSKVKVQLEDTYIRPRK